MEQAIITRKPPHYLPETPGEFFFGMSGNNYLFHTCQKFLGIEHVRVSARTVLNRCQDRSSTLTRKTS